MIWILSLGIAVVVVAVYDLTQRQHAILRNFPILGHFRIITMRKEVLALSRACGVAHPTLITADQLQLLDGRFGAKTIAELFGYGRGFGLPSPTDCDEVRRLMPARGPVVKNPESPSPSATGPAANL